MALGKKIDYVVPMVFHDDPEWQEDFRKVNHVYDRHNLVEFVRYRSWDTERLLIQCVKTFMPFVRTIYIILARESQKKDWMDEKGIRVVYHHEFIPERFLPTFNSRCIEMFLKDIPGISELFIYSNDDMFPLSPLKPEDFFVKGVPCLHHTEKPFPQDPNNFHVAALGGLNFIARDFGKHYELTWLRGGHSITPMVKSTWQHLWDAHGEEIEASISPFREQKNFNQWLCPWWHHFAGEYVDKAPKRCYLSVRKPVEDIVDVICGDDPGIVCINDNECESDYMKYGNAVKKAIEKRLEDYEQQIRATVSERKRKYRQFLHRVGNCLLQIALPGWRKGEGACET